MKKLILLCACLFAANVAVQADNDKPIKVNQLPAKAQEFMRQHFAASKVAIAKSESELFSKTYTVIFTSGDKLDFDGKGIWTEVDCKQSTVPVKIVPVAILNYVKTNYPQANILKIEHSEKRYEVKLSNKLELEFDSKFNIIDVDN